MNLPADLADRHPDRFRGRLAEYLAWTEVNPMNNPNWCPRHWAPCPVDGRNGLQAGLLVMQESLNLMPLSVARGSASAKNSWIRNQTTPTCCQLGDDKMAAIWAEC